MEQPPQISPRVSSLSATGVDWDIYSQASVSEDESELDPDQDQNRELDDAGSVILPVGPVQIPSQYRPPSEQGNFDEQRRLDVLQRMSGTNNLIQSPGDYYAEEIAKLMDECDDLGKTNSRWAAGIKYGNKLLALIIIILSTIATILSIDSDNYAVAVIIAVASGIVTIREVFNIDNVGIEYLNQSQYALNIKHNLLDILAAENVQNKDLRYSVKQARKEIDNVKAKVYIASYGPRGQIAVQSNPTVNNEPVEDDFSTYINQDESR